jgi:predicted short-subunit dehydrogenase-like oxidoreductase (DUF2520 family)
LISLLATSEKSAALAGISSPDARRRMLPIIRCTLTNYEKLGPARAFTGPIVRGDEQTIRLHLGSLASAPVAEQVYRALARAALQYLPSRSRGELEKLLEEPSRRKAVRNRKRTHQESRRSTPHS